MAKHNKSNTNGHAAQASTTPEQASKAPSQPLAKRALPEGYQEQSSDVVGFWNPELAGAEVLHFIPLEAKLSDSQIDGNKASTLIIGTLIDPIALDLPGGEEGETVEGNEGDLVGVWAKPGMAGIKKCAEVPTIIYEHGEKEVGKPNPMKVFVVASKGKGKVLEITADNRKTSRFAKTFLTAGEQEIPQAPTNPSRERARQQVRDDVSRRMSDNEDTADLF